MMADAYDVVVVGGGIAGVSIGYELAVDRRVLVVDMEGALAYHTTGRSAAMYMAMDGNSDVRGLTTASHGYLENPWGGASLLKPLPVLFVGWSGRGDAVIELSHEMLPLVPEATVLEAREVVALQPLLRPEHIELAVFDPGAMEIDVHALHQGFVRGLRSRGGETAVNERVEAASHAADRWTVKLASGRTVAADVIVNAAGAWADQVADTFGAAPVGLQPLRRSAFMVAGPPGLGGPMVEEIDEAFYFKPDAGRLLCSPADETPQEPRDARPDQLEIARAIELINEATTLDVHHVESSWAGLRSFVADRKPVVGYDPSVDGFFWFAGQGGYGIMTSPALARAGSALLRGDPFPADLGEHGVTEAAISPARLG
ncbi:MAG TPA: FAD-binding oxidoreductase [Nocardioidaceae bacterium]|nr:FAD-binding oxidoreductase [Nocardioidaceae bacterium]